jgi:hypothetical protein
MSNDERSFKTECRSPDSDFGILSTSVIKGLGFLLSPSSTTLPADPATLHRFLVPPTRTATFATKAIAAGLLAASAVATLVCAATAAASIGILCTSVACHMFLLVADSYPHINGSAASGQCKSACVDEDRLRNAGYERSPSFSESGLASL